MKMEPNLSYFNLPFVDVQDLDFGKIRGQDCEYDDLQPTLPHGSLLGTDDDVLAQFLSGNDPLDEPDLNGPTTLHCEICRKHFDNAKKYYGHLRVHSKDNLWRCDKCPNVKYSTKQQLMKHSLTHQPLEKVWRCPQCEMSFEALWRLQQHLFAKHLDYRPHKCEVCAKSFHKLSDLEKHKDVHSAVKKFACAICQRKFSDKSNLKRHILSHGNEKAYPCVGCGNRFKQIASMRRHMQTCPLVQKNPGEPKKSYRNNYCRVCGLTFQYKSSLLEHCVREHSNNPAQLPIIEPPKEEKSNVHDTNRTDDKIVDDILSAEDDYMTMSTQNNLIYPEVGQLNQDNLMQLELLKEMNQMQNMHISSDILYDDELLYNDIDIDSFQTMLTNSNIDYGRNDLFDLNDPRSIDHIIDGRSLDQDFMNAMVRGIDQVKDDLPREFLNQDLNSKVNEFLNPPVSVNDCSTIFESDVDLEASTNLAANLNQLIGENSVQYISTEHDDTFIISLNSEIDAEQLTDMLNIGVENKPFRTEDFPEQPEVLSEEFNNVLNDAEKVPVKVEAEKKGKKRTMYVCLKCKQVFKTKYNYTSHRGIHDKDLQQFKCRICLEWFSYQSTLNKHMRKMHTPYVTTPHTCQLCDKTYNTAWQLKRHKDRDHDMMLPHPCDFKDCDRKFFCKWQLETHKRSHTGEKPYACDICKRAFKTSSHLARHVKRVDCTKQFDKAKANGTKIENKPIKKEKNPMEDDTIVMNLFPTHDVSTDNVEPMAKRPRNDVVSDNSISNIVLLPVKVLKNETKNTKIKKNVKSPPKTPKKLNKIINGTYIPEHKSQEATVVKDPNTLNNIKIDENIKILNIEKLIPPSTKEPVSLNYNPIKEANSKIEQFEIKTSKNAIIIEPLNTKLDQLKPLNTSDMKPKNTILIKPVVEKKCNETNKSIIKPTLKIEPITSNIDLKQLKPLKIEVFKPEIINADRIFKNSVSAINTKQPQRAFITCNNFRMERINKMPKSPQNKSLLVSNNNLSERDIPKLKIQKIASNVRIDNKITTPNGNLIVKSNCKLKPVGNGLKMATFLSEKLKMKLIGGKV